MCDLMLQEKRFVPSKLSNGVFRVKKGWRRRRFRRGNKLSGKRRKSRFIYLCTFFIHPNGLLHPWIHPMNDKKLAFSNAQNILYSRNASLIAISLWIMVRSEFSESLVLYGCQGRKKQLSHCQGSVQHFGPHTLKATYYGHPMKKKEKSSLK